MAAFPFLSFFFSLLVERRVGKELCIKRKWKGRFLHCFGSAVFFTVDGLLIGPGEAFFGINFCGMWDVGNLGRGVFVFYVDTA